LYKRTGRRSMSLEVTVHPGQQNSKYATAYSVTTLFQCTVGIACNLSSLHEVVVIVIIISWNVDGSVSNKSHRNCFFFSTHDIIFRHFPSLSLSFSLSLSLSGPQLQRLASDTSLLFYTYVISMNALNDFGGKTSVIHVSIIIIIIIYVYSSRRRRVLWYSVYRTLYYTCI